jgi:hypothetical protein
MHVLLQRPARRGAPTIGQQRPCSRGTLSFCIRRSCMPYGARIQTNQIEHDGCLKSFGILEISIAKLGTHGAINSLLLHGTRHRYFCWHRVHFASKLTSTTSGNAIDSGNCTSKSSFESTRSVDSDGVLRELASFQIQTGISHKAHKEDSSLRL